MSGLRIAIAIDDLFGSVPGGGGQGRVILNLIKELAAIDDHNHYTLFAFRKMAPLPELLEQLPANFQLKQLNAIKPQAFFLAWHTLRRPFVDVERFLGPQEIVHAITPAVVPACRQARLILTVYDLVWWRFPQGLKPWGRFFHRTGLSIGAREAAYITAISEATRQDILARLPGKIDPQRVRTIPIAANASFTPVQDPEVIKAVCHKYRISGQYILNIGTLEPRKNIETLLRAYAALSPELRQQYRLVIVGPYGWKVPAMQTLLESHGLRDQVIWTGYIADDEMNALLSGATLFAYPSLYEGFGIPILEAMHCDVPVITSNLSSMPEVAGDAALLVDPKSIDQLSAALKQLLTDPGLRHRLVERGRIQRTRFAYRRMAEEYLALYTAAAVRSERTKESVRCEC